MSLTLVWHSFEQHAPSARQEVTFKESGSIGRASSNDFIIHDPNNFASRQHARVFKYNDSWYIEDHSTGGTYINSNELNHSSQQIHDGDILTIGDCELLVIIKAPARAVYSPPPTPPNDHEGDPAVFDINSFYWEGHDPEPYPDDAEVVPRANIPFTGVNDNVVLSAVDEAPRDQAPKAEKPVQKPQTQTQNKQSEDGAAKKKTTSPGKPVDHSDRDALKAFFAELKIDPNDLMGRNKDEVMREAGILLRTLTKSMMELLAARSSVKSTFAMDTTQFNRSASNALKFSVSAEEAMAKMLTKQDGYKGPIASAEEAINDVKAHNLAVTEGLKIALRSTLNSLSPQKLEEKFDQEIKFSLFRSAKYWAMYREQFEDIAEKIQSTTNGEFADAFRENYQRQAQEVGKGESD